MQTIKTAVVVVLLLVVLYGAYDIITRPTPEPPPEVAAALADADDLTPPDVGFEDPVVVSPEQPDGQQSPAPPLGETAPPNIAGADRPSAQQGGVPVAPQPPVSGFVPPGQSAPPADPRLQQNPFIGEPTTNLEGDNQETAPSDDEVTLKEPEPPASPSSVYPETAPAPQATAPTGPDATPPRAGERAFLRVRTAAQRDVAEGHYREALAKLSIFYQSPDLTPEEHQELLDWLDPLAARVIYSREPLLEPAYTVRRNDTLQQIAAEYNVPWELLQKINGISDPQVLVPGSTLKVLRGPFRAEIRLQAGELTLFLGELYAGRFPIIIGNDPPPQPGDYQVRNKQNARTYYGADGRTINGDSPANPYGNIWIDLGNDMAIHATPAQPTGASSGCIALSPQDAADVMSILSVGSVVKIRP